MPFLLSQFVEKAVYIFVTLAQQGMVLWHSLYGLCIFLSEEECNIPTVIQALSVCETVGCDSKNNMHDNGCGKMKVQGHLCFCSQMYL